MVNLNDPLDRDDTMAQREYDVTWSNRQDGVVTVSATSADHAEQIVRDMAVDVLELTIIGEDFIIEYVDAL